MHLKQESVAGNVHGVYLRKVIVLSDAFAYTCRYFVKKYTASKGSHIFSLLHTTSSHELQVNNYAFTMILFKPCVFFFAKDTL